ncbi:MAG: polysaccharide export protein [Verrucomicrobia bacterium]|nr:polysaccharide export protein [Verrucomicrobiota bacterium]
MKIAIARLQGLTLSLLLTFFGTSCAGPGQGAGRTTASGDSLPPNLLGPNREPDEADRKIAAGDTLIIDVLNEKGLSVERRVEQGGTISFPLLGIVLVGSKTTREVAEELTRRLGESFLMDPQVSVNVKEYSLMTVSVLGEVAGKTGAIKLPAERRMNILEAITDAGGFAPNGNQNKIQLYRKGRKSEFKLEQLLKLTDPSKMIWLEPGDVIYVPERMF